MIPDYLDQFPIPAATLPPLLRSLLVPVGMNPDQYVEVTKRYEKDQYGPKRECLQMIMALAPSPILNLPGVLNEAGDGVVNYSVPDISIQGGLTEFNPSISGLDYIVASRGDGSFYSYTLAEKVWMALGLTPRCLGNDQQKIIYDDLALPKFGIAEGEVSSSYHYEQDRNVSWRMSNEYLRRYLWMRGAYGVRVFFYEAQVAYCTELRKLLAGKKHTVIKPKNGWFELDIREHKGELLLQVWASTVAVTPELCKIMNPGELVWPGDSAPMTRARANSIFNKSYVYLDDKFLEKYEQSSLFASAPTKLGFEWWCSPSYLGQWHFTNCVRVGRNMIKVPIRELYKPKPDHEILHAYNFVLTMEQVAGFDLNEEHIVAKTERFLSELLELEDQLISLGTCLGLDLPDTPFFEVSRSSLHAEGWTIFPKLCRLAEVAPISMSEHSFLSRCKRIHEYWQPIPNGLLRNLLKKAGHDNKAIKDFGSLKLLQALANIIERLNADGETVDNFGAGTDENDLRSQNKLLSSLFFTNELRIADAHEVGGTLRLLEQFGFDAAGINQGYGRAFDHVFDRVIDAFRALNIQLDQYLSR